MNRQRWTICVLVLAVVLGCVDRVNAADKSFHVGVYVYAYRMAEAAKDQNAPIGEFIDRHFKILSEHGVNGVYLGGTGPKNIDDYLASASKFGIKLIPQLDFVYFRASWTDEQMSTAAKKAGQFIAKYNDHPQILAWSVKEEVGHGQINMLARYYAKILEFAPNARLNLIHSNLGAAHDEPVPDPVIIGTDRYGFWWEYSGGGYLASPAFALNWTRTQAGQYYPEAARRGADFMMVVTQGGLISIRGANTLCKTPDEMKYPKTADARKKLHERAMAYANDNRMGWRKVTTDAGDFYAVWKYYRLPENCIKACAWSSVLEGAKLFFIWSYSPMTKKLLDAGSIDKLAASSSKKSGQAWWTMAGRPGMPNRHLDELAETSKEIRAYENIITQMVKIPDLTVKTEPKYTFGQAFHVPAHQGVVLVLHNANVGTWPENSRYFFKETDQISINDQGDMVGYKPHTDPLPVKFTCPKKLTDAAGPVEGLFDLATGKELTAVDGTYTAPVKPGSGVLLFLGTREQAQKWHGLVKAGTP